MTEEEKDKQPELTEEEKSALKEYLGMGAAIPEDKHNVHSFLNKITISKDTTKTGNLDEVELGMSKLTLRGAKGIALIADKIVSNDLIASYFNAEAEIITSTSLSKNAKLINLAVMQKRVIEDETKPRKVNKGWFGQKDKDENKEGEQSQ